MRNMNVWLCPKPSLPLYNTQYQCGLFVTMTSQYLHTIYKVYTYWGFHQKSFYFLFKDLTQDTAAHLASTSSYFLFPMTVSRAALAFDTLDNSEGYWWEF